MSCIAECFGDLAPHLEDKPCFIFSYSNQPRFLFEVARLAKKLCQGFDRINRRRILPEICRQAVPGGVAAGARLSAGAARPRLFCAFALLAAICFSDAINNLLRGLAEFTVNDLL